MSYRAGYNIDIILSDVELIKVMSWCPSGSEQTLRDSVILHLFASTGIRLSELRMLKPSAINRFGSRSWIDIDGKGKRSRRVPLSNRLINRISELLQIKKFPGPWIFESTRCQGKSCLSKSTVENITSARTREIIGWSVNPHKFRHSIATYWIRSGVNIRTVQTLLGHTNLSSTQRYLHTSAEDMINAVDLLHDSSKSFQPSLFNRDPAIIIPEPNLTRRKS